MAHTDIATIRAAITAQMPLSYAQQMALLGAFDAATVVIDLLKTDRDEARTVASSWNAEYDRAARDLAGWVRLSAGA